MLNEGQIITIDSRDYVVLSQTKDGYGTAYTMLDCISAETVTLNHSRANQVGYQKSEAVRRYTQSHLDYWFECYREDGGDRYPSYYYQLGITKEDFPEIYEFVDVNGKRFDTIYDELAF